MNNRIHFTDMRQELVAQTFALARPAYETGNIHEFKGSRNRLVRLHQLCQLIQALIRHFHDTYVGVNCAKRIVGGFCSRLRNCIE
ncbi:hypothetical protein D3C87_1833710 [compost metagenome]